MKILLQRRKLAVKDQWEGTKLALGVGILVWERYFRRWGKMKISVCNICWSWYETELLDYVLVANS